MRRIFQRSISLLTAEKNVILLILVVAFILRIYRLDTPSMWGDEIFGPIIASKPLEYLLRWNWLEDVHPPTFYFFMKLILLVSQSDFALRLPAAVLGVLSVFLIHRLGKTWLGEQGGLLAASFLALSIPHIYLSRVVRFYSVTVVLCLLGIMLLTRFLERRDKWTLAWFATVLGALLLAEFTAVMPIMGLGVVMLVVILTGPDRLRLLRTFMAYGLAAFAVPGFFLVATMLQRRNLSGHVSLLDALKNFLKALSWLASGLSNRPSGNEYWIVGIVAVVALTGMARLAFTDRRLLGICWSFVLCGLGVILFIRPGYFLAFWHLFYLIPVLALLGASAVQAVLPSRFWTPAAIGISVVGAVLLLGPFHARFYTPTAYGADIREVGRAVAGEVFPGSVTLLDPMGFDMVNWYADQFSMVNRIREQHVTAEPGPLTVNVFLGQAGEQGHLVSPRFPVSSWAEVVQEQFLGLGSMVKAVVQRTPLNPLDFSGVSQEFDAHPGHFYRTVYTADLVMIDPYWGCRVIPTVNEKPAAFTYRFVNPDSSGNKYIVLKIEYHNKGTGNVFQAWTQFDGETPVECIQSMGAESSDSTHKDAPNVESIVSLRRERPFTTLTVGFDLSCALVTPHYPTSNLVTTGFKRLFIAARPYGPDLMNKSAMDPDFELTGFQGVESEGNRSWRWAMGRSGLSFTARGGTPMRLTYALVNPMKNQAYTVTANGEPVGGERDMPAQSWTAEHPEKIVEFIAKPGRNAIAFQFEKVNHVNDSFSETDSSPYSAAFTTLRLEPVSGAPEQAQ